MPTILEYLHQNNLATPAPPAPPPVPNPGFWQATPSGGAEWVNATGGGGGAVAQTVTYDIESQGLNPSHFYSSGKKKAMAELSDKPREKIYNLTLDRAFPRQLVGKLQEGEVGLEIECEGTNLFNAPIQWWVTHSDGSLRPHGEHPPIEYVLKKPIPREEVTKALSYLSSKLKLAGSTIDNSPRTSVHVHLNVQKLSIKQIYQIVCLYLIFEEMLIDFSGPERVGNLFCLGAKHAEHFVQVMENAIITEDFREFFSNELRYSSCNTASVGKFGSLEFRSMRGTVDQKLIQLWVDLLLLIRDKALEYENPREIVEDFQSVRPESFLHKIFGSRQDILSLFSTRGDFHTSMWDGLRLMRDVACAVKWEKPLPVKKKERTKNGSLTSQVSSDDGFDYFIVPLHPDLEYRRYIDDEPGIRWITNTSYASVSFPVSPTGGTWFFEAGTEHRILPDGNYKHPPLGGLVESSTRLANHNRQQVPLGGVHNDGDSDDEDEDETQPTILVREYHDNNTWYYIDADPDTLTEEEDAYGPCYWIVNPSAHPFQVRRREDNSPEFFMASHRKRLYAYSGEFLRNDPTTPEDM